MNIERGGQACVVTIDGPVGSGKGTISARLADRLGWHFLDSGALYRLVGIRALETNTPLDNTAGLASLAAGLDFDFAHEAGGTRALLSGRDVTQALRGE